jgi:hypothetical protein
LAERSRFPEIERLTSAKYEAGRLEDNGELLIGTADLLRFGFQGAEQISRIELRALRQCRRGSEDRYAEELQA